MPAPEPVFPPPPRRSRRPRGAGLWVLALVAAAAGLALAFGDSIAAAWPGGDGRIRLVALAVMLCVFLPMLFYGRLSRNLRNLLVWVVMFGLLAAGYSLWRQADYRAASPATAPTGWTPSAQGSGAAVIRANRRGDFVARARVDGVPVAFLVDTGASDVVLSRADARRVGFDLDTLRYTRRYATANGPVFAAPIRLREITVGGVRVANVRGAITDSDLGTSLLGMSFINRLSGFELSGGTLTLRQ